MPFIAWGGILAALVWQLGTTNRLAVVSAIVVVALIQVAGVALCWNGGTSRRMRTAFSALLLLSAAAISYLAVANTAGLDGAVAWPLFAGLVVGLLLQLRLVRQAAQE